MIEVLDIHKMVHLEDNMRIKEIMIQYINIVKATNNLHPMEVIKIIMEEETVKIIEGTLDKIVMVVTRKIIIRMEVILKIPVVIRMVPISLKEAIDKHRIMAMVNMNPIMTAEVNKNPKIMEEVNKNPKIMAVVNKDPKMMAEVNNNLKIMAEVNKDPQVMVEVNKNPKIIVGTNDNPQETVVVQ